MKDLHFECEGGSWYVWENRLIHIMGFCVQYMPLLVCSNIRFILLLLSLSLTFFVPQMHMLIITALHPVNTYINVPAIPVTPTVTKPMPPNASRVYSVMIPMDTDPVSALAPNGIPLKTKCATWPLAWMRANRDIRASALGKKIAKSTRKNRTLLIYALVIVQG